MPAFSETGNYQPFYYNCKKSWEAWCKKHGHEFYVITEGVAPFNQIPPQAQKMWVYDILENTGIDFDQAAVVDYDTFVMPDCPDFFEMSEHKWCAVCDNGFGPQINRLVSLFRNAWFPNSKVHWDNYWNSGWFIFNKDHKKVFKGCIDFYFKNKAEFAVLNKADDLNDQTIFNFVVEDCGVELKLFPRSYNVLDWHCKNFFMNYVDELGREINAIKGIRESINIFHFCGSPEFRNQVSQFLVASFL